MSKNGNFITNAFEYFLLRRNSLFFFKLKPSHDRRTRNSLLAVDDHAKIYAHLRNVFIHEMTLIVNNLSIYTRCIHLIVKLNNIIILK